MIAKATAPTVSATKTETVAVDAYAPVEITFGEIPAVSRTASESRPNPYLASVVKLAKSMGDTERSAEAGTFKVSGKIGDKAVTIAQRLLNEAGAKAEVTVRKNLTENNDGTVTVQFWTKVRETRTRKN